jgi:MarR family transcriptional regulator, 2-MHQ and catechol-resistance regulon repressor
MRRDVKARLHIPEQIKTKRAYRTCHQLIETADWLREKLSSQLANFDLTWMEFRVLDALRHGGPQYQNRLSRRFDTCKQSVAHVLRRLEGYGWIRREEAFLVKSLTDPKAKRGRKVMLVELTKEGSRKIAEIFPKHTKVVKCYLRVLDGRQQETLAELLKKLREDYAIKFIHEFQFEDSPENLDWN